MIKVVVNGVARTIDAGLNLEQLLARLELPPGRIAVERNRQVVARTSYAEETVEDGDRLEIVTLVGGG